MVNERSDSLGFHWLSCSLGSLGSLVVKCVTKKNIFNFGYYDLKIGEAFVIEI